MFKNHPNKSTIKFIIVPILREVVHTYCDIPICAEALMRKFAKDKEMCHGIDFDFSLFRGFGN